MKKLNFEKLVDAKFKKLSADEMQVLKGGKGGVGVGIGIGLSTFVCTASNPSEGDEPEND
jgi:hypothetical protein